MIPNSDGITEQTLTQTCDCNDRRELKGENSSVVKANCLFLVFPSKLLNHLLPQKTKQSPSPPKKKKNLGQGSSGAKISTKIPLTSSFQGIRICLCGKGREIRPMSEWLYASRGLVFSTLSLAFLCWSHNILSCIKIWEEKAFFFPVENIIQPQMVLYILTKLHRLEVGVKCNFQPC